jgi:hypothetical protein
MLKQPLRDGHRTQPKPALILDRIIYDKTKLIL